MHFQKDKDYSGDKRLDLPFGTRCAASTEREGHSAGDSTEQVLGTELDNEYYWYFKEQQHYFGEQCVVLPQHKSCEILIDSY